MKFTTFYVLEDSRDFNWHEWFMIIMHQHWCLLFFVRLVFCLFRFFSFFLRVSKNTCSLTLNFRFWVCLSSAMINSHRTVRYFQELDAPYRTWTCLLMLDFLMPDWEMLPAYVLRSSENQSWYWWQVPNSSSFWAIKSWSYMRN